jgi:hypothetical protein
LVGKLFGMLQQGLHNVSCGAGHATGLNLLTYMPPQDVSTSEKSAGKDTQKNYNVN